MQLTHTEVQPHTICTKAILNTSISCMIAQMGHEIKKNLSSKPLPWTKVGGKLILSAVVFPGKFSVFPAWRISTVGFHSVPKLPTEESEKRLCQNQNISRCSFWNKKDDVTIAQTNREREPCLARQLKYFWCLGENPFQIHVQEGHRENVKVFSLS